MENEMITKKDWDEFRETGLFMLMNQFLHIFGWAIVIEVEDDGSVTSCYPARVKFRGFSESCQNKAYKKVSQYMKNNAEELLKEVNE